MTRGGRRLGGLCIWFRSDLAGGLSSLIIPAAPSLTQDSAANMPPAPRRSLTWSPALPGASPSSLDSCCPHVFSQLEKEGGEAPTPGPVF